MADISIDEMKAKQWIADVESELADVEGVLKKVAEARVTVPGEEDPIMQGIEGTCKALEDFWSKMCSGFKSTDESLKQVIAKIGTTAASVVDDINDVKSRVGS